MATCFLLARLKRPPSLSLNPLSPLSPTTPTTPFTPSTSTVEISETARNILEDIIDPLVVVSYFGCSRSVQDSLCTAFEQIYKVENTSSLDGSGSNNLSGGIWGWLAPPSGNPDPVLGVTTQTLHLVYLDQELNREREEEGEEKEDFFDPFAKNPDAILAPLMAICSTQLNVISTTAQDTEADLARFTQSLEVFTSRHQARRKLNLAPMEWYWSEPVPDSTTLSPTDADPGVDILEGIIANQTDSSQERYSGHLTALDQCFGDFDCYPSVPLPTTMDAGRQGADQARRPSGSESAFLGEASITQVAQLHRLISYSNHKSSDEHSSIDCSRMANGSELYVKMQACLTQLNGYPTSFDVLGMREEARNLIRDRAFHHGELIYDRIINKYLDRLPIPQPWHTLSMMHHDAQTKAMEDIEKRYGRASGYHLSSIASDFRVHCLENGVSGANRGDSKLTISNWDMMVPTGGLFFDFYSANATALQNHHIESLQEHWQSFVKSRLPGAPHQSSESNVPSSLLPPLKDHAEFLLAVDQVRRSYLGACIPSPEAITVLESLEEWQQTESVEFLKSIANGSSSAPSSQPKRSGSISHQPTSFSSGVGANSDSNSNESSGGSAVLTDTLNNKRTSIQAITRANSKSKAMNSNNSNSDGGSNGGTNNNDNDAGDGEQTSQQHADQTPKELEQQITEILSTKLKPRRPLSQTMSGSKGQLYNNTSGNRSSLQPKEQVKGSENKIIHFGWTLHILHANTLQYAWIWSWLYSHEGSSRQNVVACDSKMYTASKWILLPPKDLIRTRKDWKITYGDRVSIVSYWFSSRNAKVELPEYLPRAQGGPCRHVVPYGETYIICKTCPADVLCMRCFRASDHTDHVMFLQCSWGTSVCACGDPLKARDNTGLHCSLHSAETHRSYSRSAKGHPCQMKFKAGDRVFHCKTCATGVNFHSALCDRCFRSYNHFGHDVVAQLATEGSICSCQDYRSWKPELHCNYHSPGPLETEYLPRPLVVLSPIPPMQTISEEVAISASRSRSSSLLPSPSVSSRSRSSSLLLSPPTSSRARSLSLLVSSTTRARSASLFGGESVEPSRPQQDSDNASLMMPRLSPTKERHRCGHIFQPGEDIYHCRDCSVNKMVVLCSRCFHGSACINHQWRMGVFRSPETESRMQAPDAAQGLPDESGTSSSVVESLAIAGDANADTKDGADAVSNKVSCDCGDPTMFKMAFDCSYHLPQEFRPVSHLSHCNYLFKKGETMYRCRTCHYVGDDEALGGGGGEEKEQQDYDSIFGDSSGIDSDIWMCRRCFDPTLHRGHEFDAVVNSRNEGFYCHCGDQTVLRKNIEIGPEIELYSSPSSASGENGFGCEDDHNRQTVLCTTEVKEGMVYYSCKTCQTDPSRIFCEPCFIPEAHEGHAYQKLPAYEGFATLRCGCGEHSAFRHATYCTQHERTGGTNVVQRCHYRASAGEMIGFCSDCYPPFEGMAPAYLCQRCNEGSDHIDHDIKWIRTGTDMLYPCACGSHSLSSLRLTTPVETTMDSPSAMGPTEATVNSPSICHYHTMIYKTTPSTTLFLHSHNHRSLNHPDHNEVTGHLYHDSDNDWTVCRPDSTEHTKSNAPLSPYLQWKDVFWLQHVNTGKYFNSMASLKITQGFQEVSAMDGPHSNNDWIVEETTWLRTQILSDDG